MQFIKQFKLQLRNFKTIKQRINHVQVLNV